MTAAALTVQQRAVLDFELRFANAPRDGRKETAIAEEFGLSAIAYYQALNWLIDMPAALAAEPVLVNRLRRRRDRDVLPDRFVRPYPSPQPLRGAPC